MKPLVLRPIQEPMIDWARTHKRCAIWAGMGAGKTSAMEYLIEYLRLVGEDDRPWLVIGPMRVARDTWPDDIARWEQFKHLRIIALTGTPKERKAKLRIKADIYTISYELAPWLVEQYLDKWPFRYMIADESDRLKGFRLNKGGERARSLARIAHNLTDRWINLTGTPTPSGLKDLWGQTWYLDRGERLGRTYTAFLDRWFKPRWSGFGVDPLPHADAEIHALLEDICITVDPKDYYDLKDPIVTRVTIKLPEKARKIYKALEKDLFAQLQDGEVEVFNEAALTNKLLQIANGFIYTQWPKWEAIHDEKIEALRSIVAESGGASLLVAHSFKPDVARIKAAFPRAVELRTTDGMRAFKAGDAQMGLAHPESVGHGTDGLQAHCNILINFGHIWKAGATWQMAERIGAMRQMQAGRDTTMWIYNIIAENTLDDVVIESHTLKGGVQAALLKAMKKVKYGIA